MDRDDKMRDLRDEWDHQKIHGAPRHPKSGGGSGCLKVFAILVILMLLGAFIFAVLSGTSLDDVLGSITSASALC